MDASRPTFEYPPLEDSDAAFGLSHPYFVQGAPHGSSLRLQSTNSAGEVTDEDDATDDEVEGAPFRDLGRENVSLSALDEPRSSQYASTVTDYDDMPQDLSTQLSNPQMPSDGRRGEPHRRGRGRGSRGGRTAIGPPRPRGRPRGSRGVPRGENPRNSRKGKRGPRALAEPSEEFKVLQGKATNAILDRDYEAAANYAVQAIQVNPEVFAAHSLLSQAYLSMGKSEESLGVLWSGAHTSRDAGVWWKVVERTTELRQGDPETVKQHLLYCYSEILKLNKDDYDARRCRLDIYRSYDSPHKAIKECERLLKIRPHNLESLNILAELCMTDEQPTRAMKAYEKTTEHYLRLQQDELGGEYTFNDLNIYLELFAAAAKWKDGIFTAKRVARWLCGRRDEEYWDQYQEDDREWDLLDSPRRLDVNDFQQGEFGSEAYGEGLPIEIRLKLGLFRLQISPEVSAEAIRHFNFLDPEGQHEDAFRYTDPDLLRETADALHGKGYHEHALRFYEPLLDLRAANDPAFYEAVASDYRSIGSTHNALYFYKIVIEQDTKNVEARIALARIYEELDEAELASEQVTELVRLGKIDAVKRARLKYGEAPPETATEPQETAQSSQKPRVQKPLLPKPISMTQSSVEISTPNITPQRPERLQKLHGRKRKAITSEETSCTATYDESLEALYSRFRSLKSAMQAGETAATAKWMTTTEALLQDFRSQTVFYPVDRYVRFLGYDTESRRRAAVKPDQRSDFERVAFCQQDSVRIADTYPSVDEMQEVPQVYKGITFTEWLDIFCEYALVAASEPRRDAKAAYETLTAASEANVFYHDHLYSLHIQVVNLSCAILLDDEEKLCHIARWAMKQFPFATDSYRLFQVVNRVYVGRGGQSNWYNSGPNQKFMMRQIKALDDTLLENLRQGVVSHAVITGANAARQLPHEESIASKEIKDESIKSLDPALLVLYGHILATAGSYPHALNYYFRAYATQSENPMTSLSIALAYFQYAIKRQSDNRHHAVMQGMAFLQKYRKLRPANGAGHGATHTIEMQEVEFNEARALHMLGLLHLAIPKYERCLKLSEENDKRPVGSGTATNGLQDGFQDADFSREAAYALQTIFALAGNLKKAREVSERWLVF